MPGNRVKMPKASELVARQLRASIVRGDLTDGDNLPTEATLVDTFGVSRPTLREALRILESESLIEIRRGSRGGAVVRPPDGRAAARDTALLLQYRRATLSQVIAAAVMVETECVRSLATSHTEADLAALRAAIEVEVEDSTDERPATLEESLRAQNQFHTTLVSLSDNVALGVLADVIRHVLDAATSQALAREGRSPRQVWAHHAGERTHLKLLEHIIDADPVAAGDLWERHLREVGDYLHSTLSTDEVLDLFE